MNLLFFWHFIQLITKYVFGPSALISNVEGRRILHRGSWRLLNVYQFMFLDRLQDQMNQVVPCYLLRKVSLVDCFLVDQKVATLRTKTYVLYEPIVTQLTDQSELWQFEYSSQECFIRLQLFCSFLFQASLGYEIVQAQMLLLKHKLLSNRGCREECALGCWVVASSLLHHRN